MKYSSILVVLVSTTSTFFSQTFTKVTSGPFVNTPGDSRSVNWVDINNDGLIDCMITNGPSGGQNNMLYLNMGSGSFNLFSNDSIVLDNKPSDGATWADTDNDGDLDCFVANWYNINNLFYLNNGDVTFTKVNSINLVSNGGFSETASWGDYDNDGLVDLYVSNSAGSKKNFLYKNLGGNLFSKITGGNPVTDAYSSRSVNWTDMDLDGDLDIFVTNENDEDENIYRNDGSGTFVKLNTGPLLTNGGSTMSGSWGDYDNDGDLDVFLANDQSKNALFRNEGNFNFVKIANDTVSKTPGESFSSSWSDVDNDGDLDLFVTNAFKHQAKQINYFYLNNGNGSFTRTNNTLTADSSWSYGCAFGDYDNDGFEDLAVATCRFGGLDQNDFLYHNDGNSNNWITFHLTGTTSNKAAIGTKFRLKALINGSPIWQMREVSAQSAYCSQNDLRVHFGLGNASSVDSVKIEWPSGIVQYSTGLAVKQFVNVIETEVLASLSKNNKSETGLSVFPNPSSGVISLERHTEFKPGDKILINDITGKQLAEIKVSTFSKQYNLDLRKYQMAPGNYSITIISGSERSTHQLILNN